MAYPNLKQSVWLVALFWLIMVGFIMLVYLLGTIIDRDLLSNPHVDTFLILVSFVLVVVYGSDAPNGRGPISYCLKRYNGDCTYPLQFRSSDCR